VTVVPRPVIITTAILNLDEQETVVAEIDNHIRFGERCGIFPESAADLFKSAADFHAAASIANRYPQSRRVGGAPAAAPALIMSLIEINLRQFRFVVTFAPARAWYDGVPKCAITVSTTSNRGPRKLATG
jgi:predicted RNA-binding Zn ribbon-like protein